MKKLPLLFIILISGVINAQDLKFLGITITGTVSQFKKELIQERDFKHDDYAGFKYNPIIGNFQGMSSTIRFDVLEQESGTVDNGRIIGVDVESSEYEHRVFEESEHWYFIIKKYFIEKYGEPSQQEEKIDDLSELGHDIQGYTDWDVIQEEGIKYKYRSQFSIRKSDNRFESGYKQFYPITEAGCVILYIYEGKVKVKYYTAERVRRDYGK